MSQSSVAEFLASAKQDEGLKQKLKAATTTERCVEIAEAGGYNFTGVELQTQLEKMSDEEVAKIMNPGVAPRRHISPR